VCFLTVLDCLDECSAVMIVIGIGVTITRAMEHAGMSGVDFAKMVDSLPEPIDGMPEAICKKIFPLIIEFGNGKCGAKQFKKLLKAMSVKVEIIVTNFKSKLGETSTNHFVEVSVIGEMMQAIVVQT